MSSGSSNKPKRLLLLGSTGSIGENALRVIAALPGRFQIVGLAANRHGERALEQARAFGVSSVALADPAAATAARQAAPAGVRVLEGEAGVVELVRTSGADLVLCAMVGMAGLRPVLAAVEAGMDVALATKEVLVAAGALVCATAARTGARLLPVDSEHSALFQCLQGARPASVRRLLLTASGGPFARRPELDLDHVSVKDALRHPRWNMGRKVTVDSATLMNKGLEIMEARWLFDVPLERIEVVIHPESLVHSLVEFVDGGVLAQLGPPDMRFAIQYALTWPERVDGGLPQLDLIAAGALHFHAPESERFPCLRLAREAAAGGGAQPAVLNAANEVAVDWFLEGRMPFGGIWRTVSAVLARTPPSAAATPTLDELFETDAWARREARGFAAAGAGF